MIKELFFIWWFFAPAGIANVAAFFSGKIYWISNFSYPVDCKKYFRGKRILGENKTFRGFIFGVIASTLIVYLQVFLYDKISYIRNIIPLNYDLINPILFGTLAGFGALFGDSLKSLFKRRLNVVPGRSWFPFDQTDYIIGGILFTSFYIRLSMNEYILLFFVWFLLHPLTTLLGYLLKLKNEPL